MGGQSKDNGGKPVKAKKAAKANRPVRTEKKLVNFFFGKKRGK